MKGLKKYNLACSALLLIGISICNTQTAVAHSASGWVHPGVLVSQPQIDYIRKQIANKAEPEINGISSPG